MLHNNNWHIAQRNIYKLSGMGLDKAVERRPYITNKSIKTLNSL